MELSIKGDGKNRRYLGDSVYVEHDGYGLTLTTENGFGPTNTIYLEPAVLEALNNYAKEMYGERTE